jgi:hypothetical protein
MLEEIVDKRRSFAEYLFSWFNICLPVYFRGFYYLFGHFRSPRVGATLETMVPHRESLHDRSDESYRNDVFAFIGTWLLPLACRNMNPT